MGWFDPYLIPVVDGVAYGLLLFAVAAGLTLAFGVGNVLNLAHGGMYALGGYLAATVSDGSFAGLAAAAALGTLASAVAGAALAGLVAPVAERGHLAQALLTFGIALIGGDLLVMAFTADELPVHVPSTLDRPVELFGHRYPGYRLAFIAVAALLAVALHLFVRRTHFGSLVRAAVADREMLATMGVNPAMVRLAVLAGAGGLAGLVGALGAPIIGPSPHTGDTVLLLSLVVVVLGGLGSIGGAFLAALAVGQIQTLGVAVAPTAAPFILFTAMALALALRVRRGPVFGPAT